MTLTARSRMTLAAASRAHARAASNLVATHSSSKHTLAGSPPGKLRELTLRRGEPIVRLTFKALDAADGQDHGDVDAKVLGYLGTRVPEPETRPVDDMAITVPNQPAPTRGPR